MDKKKEIDQIAEALNKVDCDEHDMELCHRRDCYYCQAEKLYNMGYRNAKEVAKETAQEMVDLLGARFEGIPCFLTFKQWAKARFGIEVK